MCSSKAADSGFEPRQQARMSDHDLRIGKRDCVSQDGAAIRGIQRHIHSAEQVRAEPAENRLALVRHPRKDVRAARDAEAAQRRRRAQRPGPHVGEGPGRAVAELQEIALRLLARPAVEQRPDHAFATRGESPGAQSLRALACQKRELRFHSKSHNASQLIVAGVEDGRVVHEITFSNRTCTTVAARASVTRRASAPCRGCPRSGVIWRF